MKKEVKDFIAFLKTKTKEPQQIKEHQFGAAKGYFVIHDDFDELLKDFKE